MTSSSRRHLPWNRSTRSIYIDRKYFSISFDEDSRGSKALISENGRHPSSISITWNGLAQLGDSFLALYRNPIHVKFSRKIKMENDFLWIEKLQNRFGYYAQVTLQGSNGVSRQIIIPPEQDKRGWFSFYSLLSDYPGHSPQSSRNKEAPAASKNPSVPIMAVPSLSNPTPSDLPSSSHDSVGDTGTLLIVQRKLLHVSWLQVSSSIIKHYGRCVVNPFQADKAVVQMFEAPLVQRLVSMNDWTVIENCTLRFWDFSNLEAYADASIASYGGWLDIWDLPLILWTSDIFKIIGDAFGGFLEVADQSLRWINPIAARICVCPNDNGFLLAYFRLPPSVTGKRGPIQLRISAVSVQCPKSSPSPPKIAPQIPIVAISGESAESSLHRDLKGKQPLNTQALITLLILQILYLCLPYSNFPRGPQIFLLPCLPFPNPLSPLLLFQLVHPISTLHLSISPRLLTPSINPTLNLFFPVPVRWPKVTLLTLFPNRLTRIFLGMSHFITCLQSLHFRPFLRTYPPPHRWPPRR